LPRGVITQALRHLGLQVVCASGRESLDLFRTHSETVALVLLDLGLSELDGLQTLADLRAERADIPVILTSGSELDHTPYRTGPNPPAAFLPKPYTVQCLLEVVSRTLRQAHA
jgi:CheY-like chemotaxis protein